MPLKWKPSMPEANTARLEEKIQADLTRFLDETFTGFDQILSQRRATVTQHEFGQVTYVGRGIARVDGLPGLYLDELIAFPDELFGLAFNLDEAEVGVVLLGDSDKLQAGAKAYRTGRVLDVPVGRALVGRIVDALGRPLDERGPIRIRQRRQIEQPAPPIMARAPVTEPLETGLKVIDALIPIGRGQRELILGDRQSGKSAIALDTILNQADKDVICIYCAIGQRNAAVARLIADLRLHDALRYSIVVVATGEDEPGLQFIAPYAATTMAEHFMEQGMDVLIVYDDLTHHARAYRELSLLLRRPPGREAYPGDVFYIHSRLLERATHLRAERGGGSLTALPIIETQAQDMSAYIPTNLISITDGQIYVSPTLFRKGMLPAVDVGRSVSRVGGKAQLDAYRAVAGDLRLAYAQFEELEIFSRFSTRLDDETRRTLERGRRVRATLRQAQYSPLPAAEQIVILFAVTSGLLDDIPVDEIAAIEARLQQAVRLELPDVCAFIEAGNPLDETLRGQLRGLVQRVVADFSSGGAHAGH
jgi:F-type H+-transporting ATPase subunit alpha